MTVANELAGTTRLIDLVEELEDVASALGAGENRTRLLRLVSGVLGDADPVRPSVAAEILSLNEKTVRAWMKEGVLQATQTTPRPLLDLRRIHEVLHLVNDLRAAGRTRGLLDEVYRRLNDSEWLTNPDLARSLDQMADGQGIPA
jgi:hypothetical protein